MKRVQKLFFGLAISAGLTSAAFAQGQKDWQAPDITKLPDDKYGQMVRQGKALMEQTYKHIGPKVKEKKESFRPNDGIARAHQSAFAAKNPERLNGVSDFIL